ncbi:hypothetical protein KBB17_03620 [Candidatus Saccharibacteria bacterium]|jgi:hypothetical protein|nr:hypothetical protein [Candidatus Saccharibacteria bacterium]MBP9131962.1 hypothetical protein [Candidatus Saccharibacteria bacterium]
MIGTEDRAVWADDGGYAGDTEFNYKPPVTNPEALTSDPNVEVAQAAGAVTAEAAEIVPATD